MTSSANSIDFITTSLSKHTYYVAYLTYHRRSKQSTQQPHPVVTGADFLLFLISLEPGIRGKADDIGVQEWQTSLLALFIYLIRTTPSFFADYYKLV